MNPQDLNNVQAVQSLHEFLHEIEWIIVPVVFMFIMKSFIVEFVGGIVWRFRSGHSVDEIVMVEERWARLVRLGFFSSSFYVYTIKDDAVISGMSLNILNSELRKKNILKPLALVDVPTDLRKITH